MAKRYIRLNWQNAPSVATPINAVNLNKMDKGIDDIDEALDALESSIVGQFVNDASKINNAAATYDIHQRVNTLNDNLDNRLTLELGESIPQGADMINYTTPGVYFCGAQATVNSLINCPVTSAFRLEIFKSNANSRVMQKFTTAHATEIYIRSISNIFETPELGTVYKYLPADKLEEINYVSRSISNAGYYRIFSIKQPSEARVRFAGAETFMLSLGNYYSASGNMSATLLFNLAYNNFSIVTLGKVAHAELFTKVRLGYTPDFNVVIDIYYAGSDSNNNCYARAFAKTAGETFFEKHNFTAVTGAESITVLKEVDI